MRGGGGGQVTVAFFGSDYGILVLNRNSYLALLHMIACMYELNAPIFWGHWESMHFKWAHLNSNAPGPGRNDRTCSSFAPFACFSQTANSLNTRKFWRFTSTLKEWEKTKENGDVKSSHMSPAIPGQQTFFLNPISGRLLVTPISGKGGGGCLGPPWYLRFLPVDF